jgi:hypothetical protein
LTFFSKYESFEKYGFAKEMLLKMSNTRICRCEKTEIRAPARFAAMKTIQALSRFSSPAGGSSGDPLSVSINDPILEPLILLGLLRLGGYKLSRVTVSWPPKISR